MWCFVMDASCVRGTFISALVLAALFGTGLVRFAGDEPHPSVPPHPAGPPPETFEEGCARRRREFAGSALPRTVTYLPAAFPVERFVRTSLSQIGFHDAGSARSRATFLVGKSTAERFKWQVCRDTQRHNHIPGQKALVTKDGLYRTLRNAYASGRGPRPDEIQPATWLVYERKDCQDLMDFVEKSHMDNVEARKAMFIMKALQGGHNGKGLTILDGHDMEGMLKKYKQTGRCVNGKAAIVQRFLSRPLLLYGRTFNFRLFIAVARTSPALVLYHDGYIRITRTPFSNSTDQKGAVSNSEKTWGEGENAKVLPMERAHFWSLQQLNEYVTGTLGLRSDNWLASTLRPQIKALLAAVFSAALPVLSPEPQYFALYGADLTLDADLRPLLFEVNFSPELSRSLPLHHISNLYVDLASMQLALLEAQRSGAAAPTWAELRRATPGPTNFQPIVDEQRNFKFTKEGFFRSANGSE
eukprot:TRINITY_DN6949_c0_g1_i3.p1 TRINITY_DN6949_c0_g1~~TRINITY_DN6949_c0_g1_i3.p1  ORF type:complete len:471 (+),score=96.57 TRINITY_DN6949_c0_g1_i3:97-1509(+)